MRAPVFWRARGARERAMSELLRRRTVYTTATRRAAFKQHPSSTQAAPKQRRSGTQAAPKQHPHPSGAQASPKQP
eukprot:10350709-Lingulodinium_polyedra.AAC.1